MYEAGEALRFDEFSIRAGVKGVTRVMRTLGMLPPSKRGTPTLEPLLARSSTWVRAPASGILRASGALGLITLSPQEFSACNVRGALEPDPQASVDVLDTLSIAQFAVGIGALTCCSPGGPPSCVIVSPIEAAIDGMRLRPVVSDEVAP